MFRKRKWPKSQQRTEEKPNEQSDGYNLVTFAGGPKRRAHDSKRRQRRIYGEFLRALNNAETRAPTTLSAAVTSGAPIIATSQHGANAVVEPKKAVALSPKPDHFKCITESADNEKAERAKTAKTTPHVHEDTFLNAAKPILLMAQLCGGLLPVQGVMQASAAHLRFKLKSVEMLLTLFFLVCSSMISCSQMKHLTIIQLNAKNIGLAFFSCVQLACVLFLVLAVRWPRLMLMWSRTEQIFTRPPYEQPKRKLASRLRFAALIILGCSLAEHALYLSSAIVSYRRKQELCEGGLISFGDFIRKNYNYVFSLWPYHTVMGVFILLTNGLCTFVWNYMDLFIMMVSKGIAYRFEQITMRINQLADKEVDESVFVEIREHYVCVCELLEEVDDHLSGIILLSNLNNLYFVCTQLLNIFNKLRWPINYIYFWYSLLYLIGRAAFVFLCAATINDESKGALSVLRRVSSKTWCTEVERLIFQMSKQTVALTGKKFYFLTRSLLFGMAGTIVTYELVLLQFDEPNRVKGLTDLCAT